MWQLKTRGVNLVDWKSLEELSLPFLEAAKSPTPAWSTYRRQRRIAGSTVPLRQQHDLLSLATWEVNLVLGTGDKIEWMTGSRRQVAKHFRQLPVCPGDHEIPL